MDAFNPAARTPAEFLGGTPSFRTDPTGAAIKKDSDMYKALDVLAREIKILGIFSDWPATVTHYANCMGLK
jgi:glycerophosphoryl diester phosphodiesterase